MKIRQAFVANSSSSSFVIFYKEIPYEIMNHIFTSEEIPEGMGEIATIGHKWLSDGADKVVLTPEIIRSMNENYDNIDYIDRSNFVEIVKTSYDGEIEITPDLVGCKVMGSEIDYHNTGSDVELFETRYIS